MGSNIKYKVIIIQSRQGHIYTFGGPRPPSIGGPRLLEALDLLLYY